MTALGDCKIYDVKLLYVAAESSVISDNMISTTEQAVTPAASVTITTTASNMQTSASQQQQPETGCSCCFDGEVVVVSSFHIVIFRAPPMYEKWTIAIDDFIAWSVCLSCWLLFLFLLIHQVMDGTTV